MARIIGCTSGRPQPQLIDWDNLGHSHDIRQIDIQGYSRDAGIYRRRKTVHTHGKNPDNSDNLDIHKDSPPRCCWNVLQYNTCVKSFRSNVDAYGQSSCWPHSRLIRQKFGYSDCFRQLPVHSYGKLQHGKQSSRSHTHGESPQNHDGLITGRDCG